MIVFIHIPKTGGTSIRKSIREACNHSAEMDYGQFPADHDEHNYICDFSRYDFIGGHFQASRYSDELDKYNDVKYVTWLRDPIQRLYSHWNHLRNLPEGSQETIFYQTHVPEDMTFLEFGLMEKGKNLLHQYVDDVNKFDFIGDANNFEHWFNVFNDEYFDNKLTIRQDNVMRSSVDNDWEIDEGVKRQLEKFHSKDVELYENVKFGLRC